MPAKGAPYAQIEAIKGPELGRKTPRSAVRDRPDLENVWAALVAARPK